MPLGEDPACHVQRRRRTLVNRSNRRRVTVKGNVSDLGPYSRWPAQFCRRGRPTLQKPRGRRGRASHFPNIFSGSVFLAPPEFSFAGLHPNPAPQAEGSDHHPDRNIVGGVRNGPEVQHRLAFREGSIDFAAHCPRVSLRRRICSQEIAFFVSNRKQSTDAAETALLRDFATDKFKLRGSSGCTSILVRG